MKKPTTRRKNQGKTLKRINQNAAGADIGSSEIYVAVPPDRSPNIVKCFGTTTDALEAVARWLLECKITTIAMESTSIYWIPLSRLLQDAGIDVCLVNAREVKNVPGRKTDVCDAEWIQQLHSFGLLRKSFQPARDIEPIRALYRHRDNLIKQRATQVHLMQKSLRLSNIQLDSAVSDIAGHTGMRIIRAILHGERNPYSLAALRDSRCKKSEADIARALSGVYAEEHIFSLRHAVGLYDVYSTLITECDVQLLKYYKELATRLNRRSNEEPPPPRRKPHRKVDPMEEETRRTLYRIFGVDLTQIDGIGVPTAQLFLAEAGYDMTPWETRKHFSSWLGACPHTDKSGGKVLRSKTKKSTNRLLAGLRISAQSLEHSDSYLGTYFRRIKAKLDAPKAIAATTNKISRIIFTLVKNQNDFDTNVFEHYDKEHKKRQLKHIKRKAQQFGYTLVPST